MAPNDRFLRSIAQALRPDQRVSIAQWASAQRILPIDTPEPGPWRNRRTPYLVDIMETMSPGSRYREGWAMKGHQLGGSACGENAVGAWICTAAGSILMVFPALDDARQWELTRFEPMRANTPDLRRRVRDSGEKGSDNTKLRKRYPGGVLRLVGANRVGALKSATIRYVKFEEPDEFPPQLDGQGDPITLAIKRTSNFGLKAKVYGDGTPTVEDASAIDANFQRGDQRRWHLPCPECGEFQPLAWEGFRWSDGDPESVRYACSACGVLSPEHAWKGPAYNRTEDMTEADARAAGLAHWRATAQGQPGVASWHLPSFIAPVGWRPWPKLVADWLEAQGNEEKLRAFRNNEQGLPWRDSMRADIAAEQLQQRAEQYEVGTVPAGGLVLVAAVDVQDNRLAVLLRAYGRGEESWGVFRGDIYGSPSSPETWAKLREVLDAPYKHACGQMIRVDACAIDSGGHHAEDVYAFCRDAQLRGRHWFAIKGARSYDAPKLGKPKTIEFTWRGKPVPGGVTLRLVGTQAIKNLLAGRLGLTKPGGGFMHTPLGFTADYYRELRAEKRVWKRDSQGNKALWWQNVQGQPNESWDCEVYAYVALLYTMSGRHAEAVWRSRELLFAAAPQPDLFVPAGDAPAAAVVEAQAAPAAVLEAAAGAPSGGRRVRRPGIGMI